MVISGGDESSFTKDLIIVIFQGLAVGTFLYVTFFEVSSFFLILENNQIRKDGMMDGVLFIWKEWIDPLQSSSFQILLHERDNEHNNMIKLVVMFVGFALIGLLRLIDNHDHDHGM